ncbi:hypothetical protein DFH28DRAFT_921501 [Melampsora americana]|nr:hypothetical protein DFH28DRAFT_921501 [Melampsora americana]
MATQKRGQTPSSDPNRSYTKLSTTPPPVCNTVVRSGLKQFPQAINIYDFLPFPLVYLAPPTAGFDFNPSTNCFVRNLSRKAPAFQTHPLRVTLLQEAGIHKDIMFAMKASSPWITNRQRFNGKAHAPSAIVATNRDPFAKPCGPTPQHEWTQIFYCSSSGNPQPNYKTPIMGAAWRSAGSNKVQCSAWFTIRLTLTGDYKFEWYWKHNKHNPYAIEDMQNKQLPDQVKAWLTNHIFKGLNYCSIQILCTVPNLNPILITQFISCILSTCLA